MIRLTGPLQLWTGANGNSHFMTLTEDLSPQVRAHSALSLRGFGSVRVECRIGETVWRTSVFPQKNGGYFLPVKAEICRRAGIVAGNEVTVMLELL